MRGASRHRLTAKGRATRERIVVAAARLMLDQGVGRTTIADVQAAANVGPSQLYHYFADKQALVHAVIDALADGVLGSQARPLDRLDSFAALQDWRDELVGSQRGRDNIGGCPLGTLAGELAETDEHARGELAASFARWEEMLRRGIAAMRDRGELRAEADPDQLALALLVAVQGGLLLSHARRETAPLEVAIDLAIAHLHTLRPGE
ncbi:MAG TPA: TetR family transcriptional regulator C-terminal domain-containing protein [Pseudonocardiaceae bacterium]|nr:TetR family transcriptional regulator C-terminal domain-containing protein [Pseudonocardiaceae bacterium]